MGNMGRSTGLIDSEALFDVLEMIILEGKSDALLEIYSNERVKAFQIFVDPETAHQNWLIRQFNGELPSSLEELGVPYFKQWRVDMREIASQM
jgi:hypothetical protein